MSFPTFEEIKKSFSLAFSHNDPFEISDKLDPKLDRIAMEVACQINDPRNLPQSEEEYYDCAQKLRGIGEYSAARSILLSLRRNSADPDMKTRARHSFEDSLGDAGGWRNYFAYALTLGSNPLRDWSDEDAAAGVRDVLILSSLQVLGMPFWPSLKTTRSLARNAAIAEDFSRTPDYNFDHRPSSDGLDSNSTHL